MDKKRIIIIGSLVALVISSISIFIIHDPLHIIVGVIIGTFVSILNLFLMEIAVLGTMLHNKPIKAIIVYFLRLIIYAFFAFVSYEISHHGALGYGIGVASLNITLVIFFRKARIDERK